MNRNEIESKLQENFKKMEALKKENIDLIRQGIMLCD